MLSAELDPPSSATLDAAVGYDLIGFRGCRSLNQIEAASPGPLRFVFRSDHNATVQGMVAAGFGGAIVPRLTVVTQDERVQVVELEDVPPRLIGIAWHRDRHRSPAARAFVELAQQVCDELRPSVGLAA
jgi:DNA-binding transcriptional LysR family regulator